jgi:hypothetical protein
MVGVEDVDPVCALCYCAFPQMLASASFAFPTPPTYPSRLFAFNNNYCRMLSTYFARIVLTAIIQHHDLITKERRIVERSLEISVFTGFVPSQQGSDYFHFRSYEVG